MPAISKHTLPGITVVCVAVGLHVTALSQQGSTRQGGATSPASPTGKTLSWLPTTSQHDAAASKVPPAANLTFRIPKEDPLKSDSGGGWGGIDTFGRFVPTDKKSYRVTGGTLISSLGPIEKRARYGDWEFAYEDAARTKKAGWGHCLTSGDMLVPRSLLADPPLELYAADAFEVESFGPRYLLVKLDPKRSHHLCFIERGGGGAIPTAGSIGTRVEVAGKVYERKADGWYLGNTKVPD